jgi:hypothetical protein
VSDANLIEVTCSRCQKRQRVPREQAGKQVPCANPSCRTLIDIPDLASRPLLVPASARYPLLRWLSPLFLLLGGLSLAWAVIAGVLGLLRAGSSGTLAVELLPMLGLLLVGVIGAAFCVTVAELIKLAIDVEANTRELKAEGGRLKAE